jgi:hypothetical protein
MRPACWRDLDDEPVFEDCLSCRGRRGFVGTSDLS